MSSISNSTIGEGESVPVLLPGFRFYPSDEVLVSYYLKKKIEGKDSKFSHIIPEIDVCKYEPCDVPALFEEPDFLDNEREWIFFSRPNYKYINSTRCNRATDEGFYKITGKERGIKARGSKAVIGNKRTLTFYRGRVPKAKKTDWVIHEFYFTKTQLAQLALDPNQQRDFVLCRLKNKSANYKKLKNDSICYDSAEPGTGGCIASNSEDDQVAAENDMILHSEEQLGHKDVLNGNSNHDECTESPNSSCLIDNNDISTCDNDETDDCLFSDFDHQAAHHVFQGLCAAIGVNMDSPFLPPQLPQPPHPPQPHQLPQPPQPPQPRQQPQPHQPQDCFSSKLQSSSHTKLVNVPSVYNDDCSKRQSPIGDDNSYLTRQNNISTNDHNEPLSNTVYFVHNRATVETSSEVYNNSTSDHNESVSNTDYNFRNGPTDEIISEAYFQPEEYPGFFFDPFQRQDYTLMSPMITEQGDVMHAQ